MFIFAMWSAQVFAQQDLDTQGEMFKVPKLGVQSQSRVFVYQAWTSAMKGVATVYVQGSYLASLQRGGFAVVCLAPANVTLTVRHMQNGADVPMADDAMQALSLQGGQDVFVRVSEPNNGRVQLQEIKAEQALPELVNTRQQVHTLSRVPMAQTCEDAPPLATVLAKVAAPKKAPTRENITLGADALFPFGQFDVHSIPAKGRRTLDHLIDRIKTEFGKSDSLRIHITGHADAFGTPERNLQISQGRAVAIKEYLVHGGLRAAAITAEGRGAKEPVITSCQKKPSAASIQCNTPNRRVVVSVTTVTP